MVIVYPFKLPLDDVKCQEKSCIAPARRHGGREGPNGESANRRMP